MKWYIHTKLLLLLAGCGTAVHAQQQVLRINFLYGSKPARCCKSSEEKRFGGLKGGHVNLELNGRVLDFVPIGRCHLFAHNNNPNGGFSVNSRIWWDTLSEKSAYIEVPVTAAQADTLQQLFTRFAAATPYDYAVFGQRCASASYDVLSRAGLLKKRSRFGNMLRHFYPKPLRKKLFRWARSKGYKVQQFTGSPRRKWEKDSGPF